jgi:glycosyltransferase involved in cell wall biosynthesis
MTELLSDYISPGKHVLTLQYGVDTDLFFPPPASTERKPVCLSNRKMIPLSNLEVLLQAARILNRQESPLRIDFANDGEVMPILKQEASRKQLDRTVFFLGPVDHTVMPDLLRSASIYVSMSLSDGASLSLMEAMACGTFPVLSDIAANREWITDGLNGYLIPPDSPEQLAGKLNAAWNHRELREKAAKYNRSLILEKGDRKKNMKVIERAFIQLVERSRESSL